AAGGRGAAAAIVAATPTGANRVPAGRSAHVSSRAAGGTVSESGTAFSPLPGGARIVVGDPRSHGPVDVERHPDGARQLYAISLHAGGRVDSAGGSFGTDRLADRISRIFPGNGGSAARGAGVHRAGQSRSSGHHYCEPRDRQEILGRGE